MCELQTIRLVLSLRLFNVTLKFKDSSVSASLVLNEIVTRLCWNTDKRFWTESNVDDDRYSVDLCEYEF